MERSWNAKWISPKKEDRYHPIFFKDFFIDDEIEKATLYITGLGLFEAYVNGVRVGNELLTPYISDYENYIQYFEYDITNLLHYGPESESNAIDVSLGNGWYKGRFGLDGESNNFGSRFALIAEIVIEKKNYNKNDLDIQTINLDEPIDIKESDSPLISISTDESWLYYGSDIELSGIYDGEIINRLLWEDKPNPEKKPDVIKLPQKLVKSYSLPVVVKDQLKVKEVIITPNEETVLDFGQNFAGFIKFKSDLPKGTKVRLEFGEVLQNGNFYNENYRSALGGLTYISDGVPDVVMPHFTYFGGRYVRVTGWEDEIDPDDFIACVIYSDLEQTGYIKTSDERINRLFENCLWSQKSNFIDIPTNCPQRDERLGYTANIALFAKTACYNMYSKDFLNKFLFDLRAEQIKLQGAIPTYIPVVSKASISGLSGDAATIIPMTLYKMYGDITLLETNYDLMKDWVDYVDKIDGERDKKHFLYDFGFQHGDYAALDAYSFDNNKGATDEYFISSVYYYISVCMIADAASYLGKVVDMFKYKILADNIKEAIMNEYFSRSGRITIDTQTAYILALKAGLYVKKDKLIEGLKLRLKRDCYKINVGYAAIPYLLDVLAENGLEEIAYKFLFSEKYPGWIDEVEQGATSIWESWFTLDPCGVINPKELNSCNHYVFGAVAEFMYAYMGGIKPSEPGFSRIEIKPIINHRLSSFYCKYKSIRGDIVSSWEIKEDGQLKFHFEIPKGTKADLYMPLFEINGVKVIDGMCVNEGIYDYEYMPSESYINKFNKMSIISDYMEDAAARIIIEKNCPMLYEFLLTANEEILSETLDYFDNNRIDFVPQESLDKIKEILNQLI